MIEVNASITAYQRQEVRVNAQLQRNSGSISNNDNRQIAGLSNQENQIVDDVGISQEAINRLQEAKVLAAQLQSYLDYLKGEEPRNVLLIPVDDGKADVSIDAQSTELSASISYTETTATQTDISATFTDDGELVDLAIDQIRVSEKSINVGFQSQILDLSIQA